MRIKLKSTKLACKPTWLLIIGLKHEASGEAVREVSVAVVGGDDTRIVSVEATQTR